MSFAQMGVAVSREKQTNKQTEKAVVKKEGKIQSKHIYQCINPKVRLEPKAASLNYR